MKDHSRLYRLRIRLLLFLAAVMLTVNCSQNDGGLREPSPTSVQPLAPARDSEPLIVLTYFSPWFIRPDNSPPIFVIYSDGTIIKAEGPPASVKFYSGQLTATELASLLKVIAPDDLEPFAGNHFYVTRATDQTVETLHWKRGSGDYLTLNVEGWRLDPAESPFQYETPPVPVDRALRAIHNYNITDLSLWEPDHIEIYLCGEGFDGKAMPWPRDWPDPRKGGARTEGRCRVVALKQEQFRQYRNALNDPAWTLDRPGLDTASIVQIGKEKLSASIRYPFPKEEVWRNRTPP